MGAFDGFFYYGLFVAPVVTAVQRKCPGNGKSPRGMLMALAVLAALTASRVAVEQMQRSPNFYRVVGVHRGSTAAEMKKAFRERSLELHPDKNPGKEEGAAQADFQHLQDAYAVLSSSELRAKYEVRGAELALAALESKRAEAIAERKAARGAADSQTQALMSIAAFHTVWAVVAFLLSSDAAAATSSRGHMYSILLLCFVFEISALFQAFELPDTLALGWAGSTPVFEQVLVVRSVMPAVLIAACLVGRWAYVDKVGETATLQKELLDLNKRVLAAVNELKAELASSGGRSKATALGIQLDAAGSAAMGENAQAEAAGGGGAERAGAGAPRRAKTDRVSQSSQQPQPQQPQQPQQQQGGGIAGIFSNMGLFGWMMVAYVVKTFVLGAE